MMTRALVWSVLFAASCFAQVGTQTWNSESGLPQNTVQAILQTRDGYLWFATEGGLARFDSQRFTIFTSKTNPQIRSNDARALLEDSAGTLWIGTADGLTALNHNKFRSLTTANGLPSNLITSLFSDQTHSVCVATVDGAACLEGERFVPAAAPEKQDAGFKIKFLQQYVSSLVLCSYVDREGNTWIGTESSGVTILRTLYFSAFAERSQGLDDQVRCVYRDKTGAIWFGTNSQGLTRYSAGIFTRITTAQGLSSDVIVSLGEEADGDLLVGTPDGLDRIEGQTITAITSADGLPDDFIRSLHTDDDGTIWIGTRRGLARTKGSGFEIFTHADGLGSDLIGSMVRDTAGDLWVATLGGLSRFDGTRFKNFTTADGLSSNVITALYVDSKKTLWIGTQGGGLNRYANGVIQHVTLPGLPEVIYGISEDEHARLWLASDSGTVRVDSSAAVTYGVSDGLLVNECSGGGHPGISKAEDGSLWFATLKGAALLRAGTAFNQSPPPVIVESVVIDNRTVEGEPSINVAPGSNRLVFNYAGLSFYAPQKLVFRYRLEGFDKNWMEAGNARTAFYTNLSPGQYWFHVIARNGNGVWNDQGATVGIHIQPHFYQTWWFALLMLLPLAGIAYIAYQWRVARVEAALESRFEAVLGERNRIAREIHDTLAQGFAGISVQLEIVSRKLETSSEAARQHLDQARMLVRSSLAEARRSIWELRAQGSEMEDLASRLSKMATQMNSGGEPKIAVQVRGTYRPLPDRTEDELLRIAQEAVTNAIRHAHASQIDVELAFDPQLLRMTISDDGRGFAPNGLTSGVNGHFGLQGIHERAIAVGAKLKLDSAPGAGTRVSVQIAV